MISISFDSFGTPKNASPSCICTTRLRGGSEGFGSFARRRPVVAPLPRGGGEIGDGSVMSVTVPVNTAETPHAAWQGGFDPIGAHEQAQADGAINKKTNTAHMDMFRSNEAICLSSMCIMDSMR